MSSGKPWQRATGRLRRGWQRLAPTLVLLAAIGGCTGPAPLQGPATLPGAGYATATVLFWEAIATFAMVLNSTRAR